MARADDMFGERSAEKAPPVAVTETPEFKAALEAVKESFKAEMTAVLSTVQSASAGGDLRAIMQEMAASIADMSYQGNKRDKPVDPKIMAARQAGQERLDKLLFDTKTFVRDVREAVYDSEEERLAAVRNASPKYRATSKVVLNEVLIDPYRLENKMAVSNDIYWLGEPNDAMRPLNDLAKRIYAEFRASRGSRSAIEKASVKPVWMTDNGLMIEGVRAPARRMVSQPIFNDDLDLPVAHDPAARAVNILGTIHEPAERNYQGKPL